MIILPASEWTTDRVHMNIILPYDAVGYENLVPPSDLPTDEQIQAMITRVHELGGVVIENHHQRTLGRGTDVPSHAQLKTWGVDYFEINRGEWDEDSYLFATTNGLGIIMGTDMHTPGGVFGWNLMWVEEFTPEAVFQQIKLKNLTYLFQEEASPYLANHSVSIEYTLLRPLIELGEIFKGYEYPDRSLDLPGIGILLGYIYGIFIVLEVLRYPVQRIQKKFNEKRNQSNQKLTN